MSGVRRQRRAGIALAAITAICLAPAARGAIGFGPSLHAAPDAAPTAHATRATRTAGMPVTGARPTTVLTTDVPHGLTASRVGTPPSSQLMHIGLVLAGRDEAGLSRFIRELRTPGTAAYRHPLTSSQFDARFGVEPRRDHAVRSWLTDAGLWIPSGQTTGTRYLTATGTAGSVAKLLGLRFATYRSADDSSFIANLDAPTVPSGLEIVRVLGLNGSLRVKPLLTSASSFPSSQSTNPADLWHLYDQPPANLGQGQQLATLLWGSKAELEPALNNDLVTFENANKLPQVPVTLTYEKGYVDPGAGSDPTGAGLLEAELDSQASTAMAPAASGLTMYFAQSPAIVDLATSAADWADHGASLQMSASLGGCESTDLVLEGAGLDAAFEKAVAGNKTVFVSTGDTGAGCIVGASTGANSPLLDPEYPATSPYVVAVGGTVVTEDQHTSPMSEYAWNAGGGGTSNFEALPSWQQGFPPAPVLCAVDPATATWFADTPQGSWAVNSEDPSQLPTTPPSPPGQPKLGGLCRAIPDVAAQSGDLTSGFNIISGGTFTTAAGTSLSAPLWQGMWARIQAANSNVQGNGFAAPALYKNEAAFHDITFGDNGPYPATTGWDYVSGLGSPDVTKLINVVDGLNAQPATAAPTLAQDAGTGDGLATGGGSGSPTCTAGQDQITGKSGHATQVFGQDTMVGPSQQDLDILSANLSWSSPTLTATIKVQNLSASPPDGLSTQEFFRYDFQTGGVSYELTARRAGSPTAPTAATQSFAVTVGGLTGTSAVATGSFDPATSTITIVATQAELIQAGGGTLTSGGFLTNMAAIAQRDLGLHGTPGATSTADSQSATCAYQLS